jgi:hypothetical protein
MILYSAIDHSLKPYKLPCMLFFYMNGKVMISFFGISSLFALLLISAFSSSLTLALAQTLPATGGGGSGSTTNNTGASAPTSSRPNPANQLKTNVVPKLLEKISSLSNIVAVSTVERIKFGGISIGDANLTLTLKRQTNESNVPGAATAGNISSMSVPVTVLVSKLPVHNLTEVMSMLQATRNMEGAVSNPNPSSASNIDLGTLLTSNPGVQSNLLRTISILKNVQIGVGAITKPNWAIPQTITLKLIGLPASQVASASDTTDVILVTVVPYRGVVGNIAATTP